MARNTSVMGIYQGRTTASDAVSVLQKAGFRATDISVLASDNPGSKDLAHEMHTRAPEGAAMGTVVGFVVGATLAWCVSTGTITIPQLTPLVTAGPLVAALAGAGAGGIAGWIVGFMAGMRLSIYVAKRYAGRIRRGGILLSVHCDSSQWTSKAKKILKDTGARNISAAAESAADFGTADRPTERAPMVTIDRVAVPPQSTPDVVVTEIQK